MSPEAFFLQLLTQHTGFVMTVVVAVIGGFFLSVTWFARRAAKERDDAMARADNITDRYIKELVDEKTTAYNALHTSTAALTNLTVSMDKLADRVQSFTDAYQTMHIRGRLPVQDTKGPG